MTVTTPRDCLGAHDRGRLSGVEQLLDSVSKLLGLHVVCIPAELRIPPPGIGRIGLRLAAPPQLREVKVLNPFLLEGNLEVFTRKMRIAA